MKCVFCSEQRLFLTKSAGSSLFCRNCGFQEKYHAPVYDTYHDRKYSYDFLRTRDNDPLLNKLIDSFLPMRKKSTVLDYGCGAGDYSLALAEFSSNVIGMDLNISYAKKRSSKVKWIEKDFSIYIPLPDNSVDYISCVNVIEHLHDFDGQMMEFNRVLKQGGKIFITTFDTNFPLHKIHHDETHLYEWSKLGFSSFVAKYFRVKEEFATGTFFNYKPFNKLIVKFLKPELCVVAEKYGSA